MITHGSRRSHGRMSLFRQIYHASAARPERNCVKPCFMDIRAFFAKACEVCINKPRIFFRKEFIRQVKLGKGLGSKICYKHISAGNKFVQNFQTLVRFKIQGNPAFVGIVNFPAGIFIVFGRHAKNTSKIAPVITKVWFDFNDIGSPVSHYPGCSRCCGICSKVHYLDIV